MESHVTPRSHRMLFLNTLAFTVCFAVWMFNGVLVTFLVDNGVFDWGPVEIGWLLGIPVLTGSIFRLPLGILTDKYGGKWVYASLLLFCAIPMYGLSWANDFWSFALMSFGFGFAGTGFAVGIAYTSVWYPKYWQGRALGIFGAGNAGAAITTLFAPTLLQNLTQHGEAMDQWRILPKIYAAVLILTAIVFLLFALNKKPDVPPRTMKQLLRPLGSIQVWRFGFYYFLVFGCFVAYSQWLVPYFVNVYAASLVMAGLMASLFSLPSGLIRILGGWMSDRWGGRKVTQAVFVLSIVISLFLVVPKMEVLSPGRGVMTTQNGKVTYVSDSMVKVDDKEYRLRVRNAEFDHSDTRTLIMPTKDSWQTPVVAEGEIVKKRQLLAHGTTRIYFQANMWIYAILVMIIGIVWGIGKASVYKSITDYFPNEVGVVGGMVGVIGGLGGFVSPIIFGYLLDWTGLWTSSWMLMLLISISCYTWLRVVAIKKVKEPN